MIQNKRCNGLHHCLSLLSKGPCTIPNNRRELYMLNNVCLLTRHLYGGSGGKEEEPLLTNLHALVEKSSILGNAAIWKLFFGYPILYRL